jgi:membrane protein
MARKRTPNILAVSSKAFQVFNANSPLRLAGATAFFTTFALPAILIILIQVFGPLVSRKEMSRQLMQNLGEVIGENTADELHKTLQNVHHLPGNWIMAAGLFIFLLFVATTLFKVIRDSLNQLWGIKIEAHAGIAFILKERGKAVAAILVAGLLFLGVFLAESLLALLRHYFNQQFLSEGLWFIGIVKEIVAFIIETAWFMVIFKFLPDARSAWKVVMAGGIFTGILFTFGKLVLQWLLTYSNMQTIYGASTSIVLLLLFVFYSSFIFYYGACFTKAWAEAHDLSIQPGKHAQKYEMKSLKNIS